MNYFLKKRTSRLLALLLTVCMILTMFAGCGGKKVETPTEPSEEDQIPPGLVEVKPTEPPTEPPETTPKYDNTATVSYDLVDGLVVKASPNSTANDVGTLDPGTKVEISGAIDENTLRGGMERFDAP